MQPHYKCPIAKYGLADKNISDFGPQYVSKKFKTTREQSGITLAFSSPYHHQANSLAERTIGTCKSLLKKAVGSNECPYTALWMYRATPLDSQMPSLMSCCLAENPKPCFQVPEVS